LSGRAGNTNTARPPIDRAFESVCDRCGFFETGPKFLTVLKRQRNHAEERGQNERTHLFDRLIDGVADTP
jgi:hypothetical protein